MRKRIGWPRWEWVLFWVVVLAVWVFVPVQGQ